MFGKHVLLVRFAVSIMYVIYRRRNRRRSQNLQSLDMAWTVDSQARNAERLGVKALF